MLCVARFDGYFKRLNPAWERVLGYTESELLSRPYIDFVHPDDREATSVEAQKGWEVRQFTRSVLERPRTSTSSALQEKSCWMMRWSRSPQRKSVLGRSRAYSYRNLLGTAPSRRAR
jgi:PAS domain S-box-containing protein